MSDQQFKPIICIDFDGVLHSYTSGWQGVDVVQDPPVEGAIGWLTQLVDDLKVEPVIYSSRSKDPRGVTAMKMWLVVNGLEGNVLDQLSFPTEKPPAWLTIDDRAICFQGSFPSQEEMLSFKPWNK